MLARTPLISLLLCTFFVAGCGDKDSEDESCEGGDVQCSDDFLQGCTEDGTWEDVQDCAADGMECHAEMGHCM